MTPDGQNRVFHYAILASLALHALLFLGFPGLISGARRAVESFPPPILARLIAPEPSAPPAVPAPPVVKEKPPAPPKAAKPLAIPTPVPEPIAPAKPEPASPAPSPTPQAETAPAPSTAEAPPAPVASAPPSQPAAQAGAAAAAREARTIGEYRLQLIDAAKRIKDRTRYPPIARDNNWTGSTQVSVAVSPAGAASVSVRGTSGHPVLDEHALTIFRQAAQEVPLPRELRGKAFAVEVRMDFTLKD